MFEVVAEFAATTIREIFDSVQEARRVALYWKDCGAVVKVQRFEGVE
jgi:hypothetical protein